MRKVLMLGLMLVSISAMAGFTPVTVTGFNHDVVANGVGAATTSTTSDVDGTYTFLAPDYQLNSSSAMPTAYLPATGLVNSLNTSGLSFQLANFTGSNSLRLASAETGTLAFSTPSAASVIYLLGFSGSGSSTATVTVTFSDNTTQVITGVNFADWYGGSGYAITNVGRVTRSTGATDFTGTTGPRLYEVPVALNAGNFSKNIVSVAVTRTGGSATTSILNVMAISTSNNVLPGGGYTINSSQPTGGGNYTSFTDAVTALTSSAITGAVTFTVAPGSGPYNEKISIPQLGGVTGSSRVTFMCNGATMAYNTSDANSRAAITLAGADYITFDSLNINVSAGTYGWGVLLTGQADSNIIRKCTITMSATSTTSGNHMGIVLNGSATGTASSGNNANGNQFINNTIIGGYYSVYAYGSTATYNKKNTFSGNILKDFYSYGLYAYGQDSLTISKTDVSRPARATVTTAYCIYPSTCTNLLVEKNRIHNIFDLATTSTSTAYCIYSLSSGISATQPNRIENNLIYNINNGGGAIYGIYLPSYTYTNIYQNTVVLDATATAGSAYAIYAYGTGMNIRNNISYISRAGTGTKACLYIPSTTFGVSNNNVLWNASTTGTNYIGYYSSTGYTTFAAWQAANSGVFDQQGKNVDPVFNNAASGDYTPSAPAINDIGGIGLGVTTDINGVTRGSSPDPGAYEFSLGACVNPATAGAAIASASEACNGAAFTLDLNGNSIGANQTYTWQRSTTVGGTYTDVATAQTGDQPSPLHKLPATITVVQLNAERVALFIPLQFR